MHAPRHPDLLGGRAARLHGSRRNHEGDPLRIALLEVAEQAGELLGVALRPPGRGVLDSSHGLCARGDDKHIEAETGAAVQEDLVLRLVDTRSLPVTSSAPTRVSNLSSG